MSLDTEQRSPGEAEVLRELAAFPLLEALYGRRSRRFALGDEIFDGPLAYRSRHELFEAYCPPHYADMAAAVEAFAERKYGTGGPFNRDTPGAWSDSPGFRGSAQVHDADIKACVALQAQYIFDTFGKVPGTVPTIFIMNYVQAHHLDLEFYNRFFKPGAYLRTHAEHMQHWHTRPDEG